MFILCTFYEVVDRVVANCQSQCLAKEGDCSSRAAQFLTTLRKVVPAAYETLHGLHIDRAQVVPSGPKRLICTRPNNRPGLAA